MIGHFLLTITKAQEDRVLTHPMVPGRTVGYRGDRCLVGVLEDWRDLLSPPLDPSPYLDSCRRAMDLRRDRLMAVLFDDLCHRFGAVRMNAAIRNRILSNQARRALQCPQLEAV